MVKKVVRRLHYSEEFCYGFRVGLDWKPSQAATSIQAVRPDSISQTGTTSVPSMKEPVEITLSRDMFADFLRRILYPPLGIAMMPSAIHSAYNGDFEPYAILCYRLSIRPNQDALAFGMYLSIICSESFPFIMG
jgi:hypothetical protein